VGVTYLNDGVWNGKRVIPAQWIKDIWKVRVKGPAGDYSYFFWHRDVNGVPYLSADGDGGQYINIFPKQDLVVVITQGNYLEWPLYVKQASDMMGSFILPALKPGK
jgi:CubicO group peptidase (beta-lactamase class C family)